MHLVVLVVYAVNAAVLRLARRIDYIVGTTSAGSTVTVMLGLAVGGLFVFHIVALLHMRDSGATGVHNAVRTVSYEVSLLLAIWICVLESPRELINVFVLLVASFLLVRSTMHALRAGRVASRQRLWLVFRPIGALLYVGVLAFTLLATFVPVFSAFFEYLADRVYIGAFVWALVLGAGVYAARHKVHVA
jgi:hypothetical protein